jgi:hypothetical protein
MDLKRKHRDTTENPPAKTQGASLLSAPSPPGGLKRPKSIQELSTTQEVPESASNPPMKAAPAQDGSGPIEVDDEERSTDSDLEHNMIELQHRIRNRKGGKGKSHYVQKRIGDGWACCVCREWNLRRREKCHNEEHEFCEDCTGVCIGGG